MRCAAGPFPAFGDVNGALFLPKDSNLRTLKIKGGKRLEGVISRGLCGPPLDLDALAFCRAAGSVLSARARLNLRGRRYLTDSRKRLKYLRFVFVRRRTYIAHGRVIRPRRVRSPCGRRDGYPFCFTRAILEENSLGAAAVLRGKVSLFICSTRAVWIVVFCVSFS